MNSKATLINTITIASTGNIRQAMQAIDKGALGLAFLMDPSTERFAGLVTDGDIRRALLNGHGLESPVAVVERPTPKTARVGMTMEQVASMFSGAVRVLPILDDDGKVVDLAVFDRRINLPVSEPFLGEKELQYVSECILTGWISSAGRFVTQFEDMFAEFCGTQYAIATSNGTTALHLALLALDIGPGDEVIVPSLTFIATANAVAYTGATPVFVDSEAQSWNLDPNRVKEAITPKTKAIIPVHLYGHPADMDALCQLAEQHGLAIVEDAAEAHGATYKGRRVGGIGDIATFSFYGNKIVTTGEGGMITTNRADLNAKMRILRDHGMLPERRYRHPVLGYNYRLTNLQAAVGVAQMEKVQQILAKKLEVARIYTELLKGIPGITLPPQAAWAENVYWLYSVLVDAEEFGMDRDQLMARLKAVGIDSRPLFPPVHSQPIYNTGQSLPVAEELSRTGISLPSAVNLTDVDIERIANTIRELGPVRRKLMA